MGNHDGHRESSERQSRVVRRRGSWPVAALLLVSISAAACVKVITHALVRHAEHDAGANLVSVAGTDVGVFRTAESGLALGSRRNAPNQL